MEAPLLDEGDRIFLAGMGYTIVQIMLANFSVFHRHHRRRQATRQELQTELTSWQKKVVLKAMQETDQVIHSGIEILVEDFMPRLGAVIVWTRGNGLCLLNAICQSVGGVLADGGASGGLFLYGGLSNPKGIR